MLGESPNTGVLRRLRHKCPSITDRDLIVDPRREQVVSGAGLVKHPPPLGFLGSTMYFIGQPMRPKRPIPEDLLETEGKIKWVQLGVEHTRFFHAKASIKHWHNFIAMLQTEDHVEVTEHDGKATLLWEAFKQRLGQSVNTTIDGVLD